MKIEIRGVRPEDLEELCRVENKCFPKEEAATREAFQYRINAFPGSFYVAEQEGRLVGLINGCVTNKQRICDELYEPDGGHEPEGENQTVFGLAVDPDCQRQGIAAQLMEHLIEKSREAGRRHMVLTCKERLIHYYEKFGYESKGVSSSTHGGAVWYDMVMDLGK